MLFEQAVSAKVATTAFASDTVMVQVDEVPEQPPVPLHPVKLDPVFAVAVKVTDVPEAIDAEQVVPQLMPPVELLTVPLPVPAFVIESV